MRPPHFAPQFWNLIESLVSHSSLANISYLSDISRSQNTTRTSYATMNPNFINHFWGIQIRAHYWHSSFYLTLCQIKRTNEMRSFKISVCWVERQCTVVGTSKMVLIAFQSQKRTSSIMGSISFKIYDLHFLLVWKCPKHVFKFITPIFVKKYWAFPNLGFLVHFGRKVAHFSILKPYLYCEIEHWKHHTFLALCCENFSIEAFMRLIFENVINIWQVEVQILAFSL